MSKYLYNPIEKTEEGISSGADITDWIYDKIKYKHSVGEILQYDDEVGGAILENYPFLQDLSPNQVKNVLEKLQKKQFLMLYSVQFKDTTNISLFYFF